MGQDYVIVHEKAQGQAESWLRLATKCHLAGQIPDAQAAYQEAIKLAPLHPIVNQNCAVFLAQYGKLHEALQMIEKAHLYAPNVDSIWMNWVFILMDMDMMEKAVEVAKKAYAFHPCYEIRMALSLAYASAGMPGPIPQLYREILAEQPTHYAAGSNACFVQTLLNCTSRDLADQRAIFYETHRFKGAKQPHTNDKTPDRILRVGYVGGDFKKHSACYVFGAVTFFHDRTKIEPYFYSSLPCDSKADEMTAKFQKAGTFRNIHGVEDDAAEAMIRADKIDILVDVASHTAGGRVPLFSRKPAPIQVTAWGFAHGTGCNEIDYFFADKTSVPQEEREFFTEKIWDMPCIVSYAAPSYPELKPGGPLPFYVNGYVTFGAMARYEKMSDEYLMACNEIVKQVPTAKILFKDKCFARLDAIKRVYSFMPDIARERILFMGGTGHPDHMNLLPMCDMYLDSFPHSGGVGSLEQLYMGCPVITLYGKQPSGRVTSSVLNAMGRGELIAQDQAQYVSFAVKLANDPERLAMYRRKLHEELCESPVVKDYEKAVEAAYRTMFLIWANPTKAVLSVSTQQPVFEDA